MEVTSDNYRDLQRTAEFVPMLNGEFAIVRIREVSPHYNAITIRFNQDKTQDYLFYDQLRSVVEQLGKWLRP
jgi:hypothetical protein